MAIACGAIMLPAQANAYRTLGDDPDLSAVGPVRWESTLIEVVVARPAEGVVDTARLAEAVAAAARTWSSVGCAPVVVRYAGLRPDAASPDDGVNSIEIVTEGWIERGFPAGRGATTDVRMRRSEDGRVEIVEADVYIDFADYRWTFDGDADALDVERVLLHELGHVLGLDHPCRTEAEATGGAPMCSGTDDEMRSALYPDYSAATDRTLTADDEAGLCFLYAPMSCGCADCSACVPGCTSDADCPGSSCSIEGPTAGSCVPRGGYGVECGHGRECTSRLCLTTATSSFCTKECAPGLLGDEACGTGARCTEVDGAHVCAPAPNGCSVVAPGAGERGAGERAAPLLLLLFIASFTRASRRRARCVRTMRVR